MLGVESLERAFELHAYRRAAGTPTPVVLAGPGAVKAWGDAHPDHVCVAQAATDAIIGAFLAHAKESLHAALRARIEQARGDGVRPGERRYERDLWAEVSGDALLAVGDTDGQLLLEHVVSGEAASSACVFVAAARVLGPRAPAILLRDDDLDTAIRAAIHLSETVPMLPTAVATTVECWHAWEERSDREHAQAIVRVCSTEAPGGDVRRLAAEAKRMPTPQADDAARSAAERALFEALEAHPRSRGLFALNQELDVRFGSRALEIDLASASLRLAVEVDGYFHFHDAEAYRRDRRKDIALQREGFFVVRILAEDVVTRIDDAVQIVHETMAFLHQGKNR